MSRDTKVQNMVEETQTKKTEQKEALSLTMFHIENQNPFYNSITV